MKVIFINTNCTFSVSQIVENRVVNLSNSTFGQIYHLNYPQIMPAFIDFTQHLIAPLGNIITVKLNGLRFGGKDCENDAHIEVLYIKSVIEIFSNTHFNLFIR